MRAALFFQQFPSREQGDRRAKALRSESSPERFPDTVGIVVTPGGRNKCLRDAADSF